MDYINGKICPGGGGEGWTTILEHGREVLLYCLPFLTFSDPIGSVFYAQLDLIDPPPVTAEKIGLSLSHLVPEIIWPKVGLNFHKNLSFDHFEAFVPIFSLIFDPQSQIGSVMLVVLLSCSVSLSRYHVDEPFEFWGGGMSEYSSIEALLDISWDISLYLW